MDGSLLHPASPRAPPSLRPIDSEGTLTRQASGRQNERRKGTVESIFPLSAALKTRTGKSRRTEKDIDNL